MTRDRDLKKRSTDFAHAVVKIALAVPKNVLGLHIQKQLIRCSTSVAANSRAACLAQTKRSFISKLSTVIEEADESLVKEAEEFTATLATL